MQSLILTLGGLGEFSKFMQTLDYVSGLHNYLEFFQPSSLNINWNARLKNADKVKIIIFSMKFFMKQTNINLN